MSRLVLALALAVSACSKGDSRPQTASGAADPARSPATAESPNRPPTIERTNGPVGVEICDRLVKFERACLATLPRDQDDFRRHNEESLERSITSWRGVLDSWQDGAEDAIDETCRRGLDVLKPQLAALCPNVKPEAFGLRRGKDAGASED